MKPEHALFIFLVLTAVLVIAGFLIAVVIELRRTHLQLITILGAVVDTVDKTDGLEGIVNDIADDLAFGQNALGECVDRLEQRLGAGAAVGSDGAQFVPEPVGPPPIPVMTPWSPLSNPPISSN
ncbi:MAG: hypothetical protein ACRDMZ_10455 [Solirubrobacteraceae bacterium]